MIPEQTQIATSDISTWRVVPAESNPGEHEYGTWAVAAGDSEEYDLYLEVLDAEHPRQVAQFIVDAVTNHARRLQLHGALAHVEQARRQQHAVDPELTSSTYRLPDVCKLSGLAEILGRLATQINSDAPGGDRAEQHRRLYAQLTQLALATVAWMESILAREIDLKVPDTTMPAAAASR